MDRFFAQVYRVVQQVPPGKVTSYGAIARMLGQPHAARTVGWALNSLPEGLDVPWHRVVNSQGRISLREGAAIQREMLEAEGIVFGKNGAIDMKRFGWRGLTPPEVEQLLAL